MLEDRVSSEDFSVLKGISGGGMSEPEEGGKGWETVGEERSTPSGDLNKSESSEQEDSTCSL